MSLLDPRVWLAILLAVALAYGGGRWQQSRADAARYDAQATRLALDQARVQVKAVDEARLEEQRRTAAQTKATNEAIQQADQARADARVADAAARELRARVAALAAASRAAGNSPAVASGAPADPAVDLLADLFGRADAEAGELAAALDAARIAGQLCERSYDALSVGAGAVQQ